MNNMKPRFPSCLVSVVQGGGGDYSFLSSASLSIVSDYVHLLQAQCTHLPAGECTMSQNDIIQNYFLGHDNQLTVLKWPSQSPDLNLSLWDVLKWEDHIMDVRTTSQEQLCDAFMPI